MRTPRFLQMVVSLNVACAAASAMADATPADATMSAPPTDAPKPGLRVIGLADFERAALANQPQILAAQAQTRIAQADSEETRASLLPQITATGEYTYGTARPISGATSTSTANSATTVTATSHAAGYWSLGLNGTQLIYDFGQAFEKDRAARRSVDADAATEKATEFQVLVTLRTAYFTARANKELVGVAQETLDDQQKHLTQVSGFVQAGTQPQIALAQQRAAVASAQVQLLAAQNNYEVAKAQLNQSAGVRGATDYDVGEEVLGPIPDEDQPLDALLRKALVDRPELASFQKQREAEEALIRSAKGGYGPTLSALGGVGQGGPNLDNLTSIWDVGLLLSWPVFQGGLTVGQVHQAEATLSSVDASEASEILQVQVQVDSARLAVRSAKATIGAAQDGVTNAREQLRLAEQRYATGVGNIIELNDAQVSYTSAAAQLVQARYQLASARAQLLAALGRT